MNNLTLFVFLLIPLFGKGQTNVVFQGNIGNEVAYFIDDRYGRFDPGLTLALEINSGYFELGCFGYKTVRRGIDSWQDSTNSIHTLNQYHQMDPQFLFGCGRRFKSKNFHWGYGLQYLMTPFTFYGVTQGPKVYSPTIANGESSNHTVMLNLRMASRIGNRLFIEVSSSGGYLWDKQSVANSVDIIHDLHFGLKYYPPLPNKKNAP